MLSPFDKKNLQYLFDNEKFDSFLRFYTDFIERIKDKNIIGETEFETLKLVFSREAELDVMKQFMRELEEELHG